VRLLGHRAGITLAKATGSKSRSIQQLAPDDWVHAAIEDLLKHGAQGLRIACLARELGVTPGSFYRHFRDRDQFRDRILEYWMNRMIVRAASVAGRAEKGARQLRALPNILVDRKLPDYDAAMRTWALADPIGVAGVAKADALRIRQLTGMFEEAGFSKEVAAVRAQTVFWIFLGAVGHDPKLRLRAFKELIEVFLANK
jgi:AcrR family transcriptional regulator